MSPIEQIQLDIAGRLDAGLPYVTVTAIRPRTAEEAILIQTKLNAALAGTITKNGKAGIVIIVDMPSVHCPEQDAVGPQLMLLPTFRIIENPVINMGAVGTGISAEQLVITSAQLLHDFTDGLTTLLASHTVARQLPEFIKEGKVAYDVFLERRLPLSNPPKTCPPKISGTSAAVTITCSDATAAIYYTTDGSYPYPGNAAAIGLHIGLVDGAGQPLRDGEGNQLYSDNNPFSVPIGTLVRAVAYNPNKQASNLAAKEICT